VGRLHAATLRAVLTAVGSAAAFDSPCTETLAYL
jgi:hypothetical protein